VAAPLESPAFDHRAYRPVPLDFLRLPPDEQLARSRAFLDLMTRRRSVRQFSPEPVEWELIENAVRVAGTAPSGANQQPWRFVVVSDPAVKQQIREAAEREEYEAYHGRMPDAWHQAIEPIGTDWVKPHITDAPYVVVVFELAYGLDGDRQWKHYYVKESVGIATGLFLAALHDAGLATLCHTPSPMGFLREILDRPRNERPFLIVPVGYPAEGAVVPDVPDKELDEILVRV
jgi:iodotyrosine deiodinase